ncbi:MAG: TIM23 complex component [Pycnora praestabilis]|nr:MAG: TIM23 complex component [Pycnora praestabilis]
MLCTPPSPLRSAAFSCQIQPSLFTAASHTSAATSLHRNGRAKASALRSLNHRISPTIPPSHIILRPSSTIAFVRPLTTATSTPTDSVSSTASPNLTWNDFLRLRKVRRRYNLAASISCSIATTAIGIPILSQQDIDALGGQVFGLDPLVVLGLATASFGAVGWFAGPLIGGTAFNMVNGRWKGQIAAVSSYLTMLQQSQHVSLSALVAKRSIQFAGEELANV